MPLTNFYLSEQDQKKILFWSFIVLAALIFCLLPELAFAKESSGGEAGYWGAGAQEIRDRSDRSFREWWEVGSTWMIWIGLATVATTVMFFKGAGWYIGFIICGIAAWGENFVDWWQAM